MPNIWFDVTTIVNWRRPAVGIVRVEAECFKYLSTPQKPEVRFCHFDKRTISYLEISADAVREIMRKWDAPLRPEAAPVPPGAARRLKDFTRHSIEKMPGIFREPTLSLARETLTLIGRIKNRFVRSQQKGPAASSPPPFRHGDVYVSSGLDWDYKDLPYLYTLKTALGLKVILFCYDLIPVLFPHLCGGDVAAIFTQYFVNVAKCADQVFCISQSSRRDLQALVRETGALEPLMPIIKLGSNLPAGERGDPSPEIRQVLNQTFLLFVSTIERRKNHEVIYRAITRLVDQGRTDLPLIVFVGMPGWGGGRFFE